MQPREHETAADAQCDADAGVDECELPAERHAHQGEGNFVHERRGDQKRERDADRKLRLDETKEDRHGRARAERGERAESGRGGITEHPTVPALQPGSQRRHRQGLPDQLHYE
jgi:hypothetical protein